MRVSKHTSFGNSHSHGLRQHHATSRSSIDVNMVVQRDSSMFRSRYTFAYRMILHLFPSQYTTHLQPARVAIWLRHPTTAHLMPSFWTPVYRSATWSALSKPLFLACWYRNATAQVLLSTLLAPGGFRLTGSRREKRCSANATYGEVSVYTGFMRNVVIAICYNHSGNSLGLTDVRSTTSAPDLYVEHGSASVSAGIANFIPLPLAFLLYQTISATTGTL